mmetsp:Transcript_62900/g.195180  ORF Transcript_62900/g.195180 Transcript_62900/m.195180 type:complete len:279 (+) Transcript_62900:2-838(+)
MAPPLRGSVKPSHNLAPSVQDPQRALGQLFREAYLRVVQNNYWDAIEDGIIPRNQKVARILLRSTDEAMDNSWLCLSDWDVIMRDVMESKPSHFVRWMAAAVQRKPLCWVPGLRNEFSEEAAVLQQVYVALSFQEAHARAQSEVPKYFAADDELDAQVHKQVARESSLQCSRAAELLGRLPPEAVELGKSHMLARKLLQVQLDRVGHMKEKGLLTDAEASFLQHQVKEATHRLSTAPRNGWGVAKIIGPSLHLTGSPAVRSGLLPQTSEDFQERHAVF